MKRHPLWGYFLATIVTLTATMFSGTAVRATDRAVLDRVLNRGYIIVGTSSTNAPFGYRNDAGKLVGFDIDVSHLLADAIFHDPSKVKFDVIPFSARWASLRTGKVDCVIMLTTVLPHRIAKAAFTSRYVDSGMVVIVRKGSKLQSIEDVNKKGVKIATLTVPENQNYARTYLPNASLVLFSTYDQDLLAVKSGRADALLTDLPVAEWDVLRDPAFRIVPGILGGVQNYAIASELGAPAWSKALNTFVEEMRHGSLYPQYSKIYLKWFKRSPPPPRYYKLNQ